jgi:aminopeptidase-like protein
VSAPALAAELYPICRSLTGEGTRRTLRRIAAEMPLEIHEVPSGTRVLDWTVPDEWNVRDAWIDGPGGERIVDFADHNLHLMGYSEPIDARLSLTELLPHLHSLPGQPDAIPYRTSYYKRDWGFCLPHARLMDLPEGQYDVHVGTTLEPGSLSYGECHLPGDDAEAGDVLISTHVCHPSLANDNLSGIFVATELAKALAARPHRLGYRFLFVPGTIGSIAWLARSPRAVARVRHGLVLTCCGDRGPLTYKRSRRGDAPVDRAAALLVETVQDFVPWGYDERQYCSPGFDLPVGCLMRTPHGCFPEYHTSGDDLDLIDEDALADTLATVERIVAVLEGDATYVNLKPEGEPQLGRYGLYDSIGGARQKGRQLALLWILNQSDGTRSLLDVAERSGLAFEDIRAAADALLAAGLLSTPAG